jgi:hypothetical protein
MAYLNANIPVTYAQIRREYLYDLKAHHGEVEDCIVFGITAITGRPILFHAIMENGAVFYRLPISAFIQRGFKPKEVPQRRLDELELWNCFSYYPAVTSWDILDDGNYAAQPNNRIIWDIPSFTVKDNIPDWKVQTSEWNVEDTRKWRTEDTDNFFYEIEEKK